MRSEEEQAIDQEIKELEEKERLVKKKKKLEAMKKKQGIGLFNKISKGLDKL